MKSNLPDQKMVTLQERFDKRWVLRKGGWGGADAGTMNGRTVWCGARRREGGSDKGGGEGGKKGVGISPR